jgi:molybdopterin-guanine dinucleotide biosynthesis protein A
MVFFMYKDITGIVLCGGKSSRFGEDKARIKLGDKELIEVVSNLMLSLFPKVFLSTNESDKYKFLGLPLVKDIHHEKGPLAGIHASLQYSETEKNFFIPVDMPLLNAEVISSLINYETERQVVIFNNKGRDFPLCGVYKKSLFERIDQHFKHHVHDDIKTKNWYLSMQHFLSLIEVEVIKAELLPFYKEEYFLNINSQQDYESIKAKLI